MKLTKIVNLMALGLALTVVGTGCRKKTVGITPIPGSGRMGIENPGNPLPPPNFPPGPTFNNTPPPTTDKGPGGGPLTTDLSNMNEDHDTLKSQTVYFDFDKSSIRASEQPKVSEVANYLKANSGKAVRVAGNCDERGTEEYNRSLGERRALAAREALVGMGVDPNRIDTVSYGEDKPAVEGHDESAYSKNRRDEFIVLTPK
jgi:peptidoglycan-associated lipoprotein